VHLNRNFISTLTHAATEFSTSTASLETPVDLINSQSGSATTAAAAETTVTCSELGETNAVASSLNQNSNIRLLNPLSLSTAANSSPAANTAQLGSDSASAVLSSQQAVINPPSNLLVIFLQSCSAVLQETKIESTNTHEAVKLFMLILVCISEDQYANSLLHDSNMLYSVFLYHAVRKIIKRMNNNNKIQ
jgi:hypothetical protein